jgi:hypothetical protein
MTRTTKANDRDHAGLAAGTASIEEHLPRYFAKSGHADADPKKVKKEGGGKGNWGHPGEEAHDYGYNMSKGRRHSNGSVHNSAIGDFKTKFETVDADPVFEEETMGVLEKEDTTDSASGASVDEEDQAQKA